MRMVEKRKQAIIDRLENRKLKLSQAQTVVSELTSKGEDVTPYDQKELKLLSRYVEIQEKAIEKEQNILLALDLNKQAIDLHKRLEDNLLEINLKSANSAYDLIEQCMEKTTKDLAFSYSL